MNKYIVTIEFYGINRKNQLVCWAENEDAAIKFALRSWKSTQYKSIEAKVIK